MRHERSLLFVVFILSQSRNVYSRCLRGILYSRHALFIFSLSLASTAFM